MSCIGRKAFLKEHIMRNVPADGSGLIGSRCGDTDTEMMEITAVGMGLMMTGVAVALGGLTLEATFLMLGRALRSPARAASVEPTVIHLS